MTEVAAIILLAVTMATEFYIVSQPLAVVPRKAKILGSIVIFACAAALMLAILQ